MNAGQGRNKKPSKQRHSGRVTEKKRKVHRYDPNHCQRHGHKMTSHRTVTSPEGVVLEDTDFCSWCGKTTP